ncbi:MAG: endonuclease/exonuclease/phosphatase family protein [Polyangiaceae bacterium]
MRRVLRVATKLSAYAYPAILLVWCLSLYWVGERWWVTAAALYAPRALLALPLPFIAAALWATGLRRLLWTQILAAALVLFPLMGFVMPWPSSSPKGRTLRLLSFNVDSAFSGAQGISEQIVATSPDVVLVEEAPPWDKALADGLRAHFPFVETSTQFIIASKFPIESSTEPAKIPFYSRERSPRFMRYVLRTPLGPAVVYCVHPLSPRGVLHINRFRGAFHQLLSGQLLTGDSEAEMESNATLRALQVEAMALQAGHESLPVIIAGDTNLPGLSSTLRRTLASYEDGFSAASWGFGYTYPTKHPFLRLDRVVVSEELRVVSFQVGCRGVSDHLCVVADIGGRQ